MYEVPSLTLTQWFARIESLHPKNIELGLHRVATVAKRLAILPVNAKVFTIAGTNGKGSSAALLAAILQAAGYTTAVYTSPHLLRFNERISVNGALVSDAALHQAFEAIEQVRGEVSLTYFEFTTLAAFYLFQQANVQVWVLEVGLGGRLDAVNLVDPDIAMITTIAMDHMDWLGYEREQIGGEKAGIIRQGIPVICGDPDPTKSLLDIVEQHQATIYCINKSFSYQANAVSWSFESEYLTYTDLPLPKLPLQNAATVLMALSLSKLSYDAAAVSCGLLTARLIGRFQEFFDPLHIVIDVAHNPQSAGYLADQFARLPSCLGNTKAIVGMLADKDIENTLRPLLPYIDEWYGVSLDVARGENADNMANYLRTLGVSAYHCSSSVSAAYCSILETSSKTDRVLVFGSFYTVAEMLSELKFASPESVSGE